MENKNAICESDSVYEIIKKVLLEQDINSYEPEVIENLIDFADTYINETLRKAKLYMEHANRKELDISDVKLAIAEKSAEIQKTKLTHKELIELAREHNKSKLPPISTEEYGLHLPPDVLTNCNYKMLSQTPKYAFNYPMGDLLRHGGIMGQNIPRTPIGLPTIIRANTGGPGVNLNPQRIIFKPQINKNIEIDPDGNIKKRKAD